jgi:hypothetical protein
MSVKLNTPGKTHANMLIAAVKVDRTSPWSFSSAEATKELGDPPDYTAFGKIHLGVDTATATNIRGHYKYPFAKNGKLYRKALIAIKSYSATAGATDINAAATKLLDRVDAANTNNDWIPEDMYKL